MAKETKKTDIKSEEEVLKQKPEQNTETENKEECNKTNCQKHNGNHKHHCECGDDCNCSHNDVDEETLGYLELAQRIQADFENYKRRNAEIEKQSFNNGVFAFVSKLLPVMDSFKQAKETIKDENALKGLELIHNQIIKALSSFGIYKIECLGQKFDPHLHNAVLTDCDETKEDEVILEELQEGYKTDDKVIRHSVVKINKL